MGRDMGKQLILLHFLYLKPFMMDFSIALPIIITNFLYHENRH